MSNAKMGEVSRKLRSLIKIKTKKEFDPDMVELFLEALSDYSPEDILRGIKACAKSKTYGIEPSDILEHIKPNVYEEIVLSMNAIAEAVDLIKKRFAQGIWDNPYVPSDGPLFYAFKRISSRDWTSEDSLKYLPKEFESAYETYERMPNICQQEIESASFKASKLPRKGLGRGEATHLLSENMKAIRERF